MGRCRQCNVEILDHTQICPLCRCVVEQNKESETMYPDIRLRVRKLNLAVRIFLFGAILTEVFFIYLNINYVRGIWWSAITDRKSVV